VLIKGIMSLKKSRLKPRYILIKTPSLLELRQPPVKNESEKAVVDQWDERAKSKLFSDFEFDLVIANDDFDQTYRTLRDFCISKYWSDVEED
jgi:guanylate kinase